MPDLKYGLGANINSFLTRNNNVKAFEIKAVRVKFVFLDLKQVEAEYPELYKKYGGQYSLGGILFDSITRPSPADTKVNELSNYTFAQPLFTNLRNVPLINEIVYIMGMPSVDLQDPNFINKNTVVPYYFQPVNLWNSVHNNALPDPNNSTTKTSSEQKTNQQVEAGSRVKVTDGVQDITLGETFKERANIKNLQPYEGDVIYEGRWGQSIRFGSTVKDRDNNWSSTGTDGDPILIIRNGQYNDQKEAWYPITENINLDSGSVYFGTTQKIPLEASSANYGSYKQNPPTTPKEYSSNQIIINSGRVVINSFEDHILLTSKKSVNLNAAESVNIDSPETIIQSPKVYLSDKNATEPVLLGNETVNLLNQLISNLSTLANACSSAVAVPVAGGPIVSLNAAGAAVAANLTALQNSLYGPNLENIKSKNTFTK